MAQLAPYLTFNGQCREVMTFYKECLGGELNIQTMGESPMGDKTPAEAKNHIMHSTLVAGDITLMASDMLGSGEWNVGTAITLCINCRSEEEIHRLFSKLSAGGKISHELKVEFWGAIFGMFTDKFGINWMLNYEKSPKA